MWCFVVCGSFDPTKILEPFLSSLVFTNQPFDLAVERVNPFVPLDLTDARGQMESFHLPAAASHLGPRSEDHPVGLASQTGPFPDPCLLPYNECAVLLIVTAEQPILINPRELVPSLCRIVPYPTGRIGQEVIAKRAGVNIAIP